jgi:hypothetical protein
VSKAVDFEALLAPVATTTSDHAPEYAPRASLIELAATGRGSLADEADALLIIGGAARSGPHKGKFTILSDGELTKVVDPAVDRWIRQYGAADSVEMVMLVGAWKPYAAMTSYTSTRLWALQRLRRWLAHVPEPDYRAALTRAMALSETLPEGLAHWKPNDVGAYNSASQALAFLFPDCRPLFDRAVTDLVDNDWVSTLLLGSVKTLADFEKLEGRIGFVDWDTNAATLVRALGDDALPLLVAYSKESATQLGVARALTTFATRPAAEALSLYVGEKRAQPLLAEYFTRHRALAKAVLRPLLGAKKKPIRDAAMKLLAKV